MTNPKHTSSDLVREMRDLADAFGDDVQRRYSQDLLRDGAERFIIPKPDPLVEALIKGGIVNLGAAEMAADIREALAKRGLKIVEAGQ